MRGSWWNPSFATSPSPPPHCPSFPPASKPPNLPLSPSRSLAGRRNTETINAEAAAPSAASTDLQILEAAAVVVPSSGASQSSALKADVVRQLSSFPLSSGGASPASDAATTEVTSEGECPFLSSAPGHRVHLRGAQI